jgi:hypothetical protein
MASAWGGVFVDRAFLISISILPPRLADFPGKGHRRSDLTNRDVLFFSVYQYLIIYRGAATIESVAEWQTRHQALVRATFDPLTQRVHPPQPRKPREITIGRIEHATIFNRHCRNLRVAHKIARCLALHDHPPKYRPVPIAGH